MASPVNLQHRGSNVWWTSWKIRCCRFPIGACGWGRVVGGCLEDDDDFSKHGQRWMMVDDGG